jgi:phage baseplate assembly protein W
MNPGYSIKLPFQYDPSDGPYKTTKTIKETISQNLRTLFLTNPGERIMNIDFGVGIKKFLFENFTPELIDRLEERIRTQIAKYIKGVRINRIKVYQLQAEPNAIEISLDYSIPGITNSATFSLGVTQ